jgi:hypothetical protein
LFLAVDAAMCVLLSKTDSMMSTLFLLVAGRAVQRVFGCGC